MAERPWSKFFWSDWEADQGLRLCSLAAQGLWMRMLCVCARHEPRGFLAINGNPIGVDGIAQLAGVPKTDAENLLAELERNGVFSRNRSGTIYSRRIVRDEKASKEGRKHKLGGLSKDHENKEKKSLPSSPPTSQPPTHPSPHMPEARGQIVSAANAAATGAQQQAGPGDRISDDDLLSAVMQAVGLTGGQTPTHWMPPAAAIHVGRWRSQLGLDAERILAAARESRKRHADPPNGPKALDGVMRGLAQAITADPLKPANHPEPTDARRKRWRQIASQA